MPNGIAECRMGLPNAEWDCRVPTAIAECRMRLPNAEWACRMPNAMSNVECLTNAEWKVSVRSAPVISQPAMHSGNRHSQSAPVNAFVTRHSHSAPVIRHPSFPFGIRHSQSAPVIRHPSFPFGIRHSHSAPVIRHPSFPFGNLPFSFDIRQSKIRHSALGNRQSTPPPRSDSNRTMQVIPPPK
jgi:hypothetical protein